jgi:hypothetical protein
MTDRARAVASAAHREGSWLGELHSSEIQELRKAGYTVQIFNQKPNGQWACEVSG